jgi:hypothetical protein
MSWGVVVSVAARGQGCSKQVVGGAVEVVPGAVVAAGGARVGVAQGVLDVLQRSTQAEELGGVGVAEAVRSDTGPQAGGPAQPIELGVGEPVAVGTSPSRPTKMRPVVRSPR